MSIVSYVGRMGSGKSYGVVENVIIPALKAGRHIVTNIPLKTGYLADDFPEGKITQFSVKEPLENPDFFNLDDKPEWHGAIIVIDEAWRYWSTGTKASQIPNNQKSFFTEHRHYVGDQGLTCEIVLVTQNLDQISSFVRELIEDTYRATKLSALGMSKSYRVDVFTGAQKGLTGGKPNRTLQGTYKPEVFKYYQSHTKNKTDFASGMEEKSDKRNNIFKSKLFLLAIPLSLIVIFASINSLSGYFSTSKIDEKKELIENENNELNDQNNINKSQESIRKQKIQQTKIQKLISFYDEIELSEEYLPLSEDYRIVGKINSDFIIYSKNADRTFNFRLCAKFSTTFEDYCVYNKELITWYSSTRPTSEDENYLNSTVDQIF